MIFSVIVVILFVIILLFVNKWIKDGKVLNKFGMIVMFKLILIVYVMINKFFWEVKLIFLSILIFCVIIMLNIVIIVLLRIGVGIIVVIVLIFGIRLRIIRKLVVV